MQFLELDCDPWREQTFVEDDAPLGDRMLSGLLQAGVKIEGQGIQELPAAERERLERQVR